MNLFIGFFYGLCLFSFAFPMTIAILVWQKSQSPVAQSFLKVNALMATFFLFISFTYMSFQAFPEWREFGEAFFSVLYFLIYAALIVSVTQFLFQMIQKKAVGIQIVAARVLAGLGIVLPILVLAFVSDLEQRIVSLRFWLNGVYVPLFLVWNSFQFVQAYFKKKRIRDTWKKVTLNGCSMVFFLGIPLFVVDMLWPYFQLQLGVLPRGWNFNSIVFLAWNVYFYFRWMVFPTLVPKSEHQFGELPTSDVLDQLTVREREVLTLLLKGKTNSEIAQKIGTTLGTVKNHVYNIYNKTGASSRKEITELLFPKENETPGS